MELDMDLMEDMDEDEEGEFAEDDEDEGKSSKKSSKKFTAATLMHLKPEKFTGKLKDAAMRGNWLKLGSTEWLAKQPDADIKMLKSDQLKAIMTKEQLARPVGTDCHPSGQTIKVSPRKTKYAQSEVGGYCAYHLRDDGKPWSYVEKKCSGHFKTLIGANYEWAYCPTKQAQVPVSVDINSKTKASGRVYIQLKGAKGWTKAFKVKTAFKAATWTKINFRVPVGTKKIQKVRVKMMGGASKFCWSELDAQFGGGFSRAFSGGCVGKDSKAGHDWKKLVHVKPQPKGGSTVRVAAFDAQSNEALSAEYTLLTPSELKMSASVIEARLHALRAQLVAATNLATSMSEAAKARAVRRVVMTLGGEPLGDDAKFLPVGLRIKKCKAMCSFKKVKDDEDHIVLMYSAKHLFTFDRVKSGKTGSRTKKKSFLAPNNMKHGQMLITLSWGAEPSDLDLFVVAPAKHGVTEIGGGKEQVSAALNTADEEKGVTINWMNTGDADTYPFTVLDVDAMSGYGPETVTVHKPVTGTYKIYVHCYSCSTWDTNSYKTFFKSDATVRVFDRLGMKAEFQIGKATGKPDAFWGVAHRTCLPPAPLAGEHGTKKGFANRDNIWNFSTKSKFYKKAPK